MFAKGKGKGGKNGYRPYQGAWNNNPTGVGYQGICWNCGEVGHLQRECPKAIQKVDWDNIECDFFFGAVEAESIEEPPMSDFERTFRRIRRGVRFGTYSGECKEGCSLYRCETGNKFAKLSEEKEKEDDDDDEEVTKEKGNEVRTGGEEEVTGRERTDDDIGGGWNEVKKKMRRVKKRQWKRIEEVGICNVEEGEEKGKGEHN